MNIIDRFKNQRVSQLIHLKNRAPGAKSSRVENCYRLKSKRSHNVSLRKKEGAEKAHYGDLQSCGSVWACPVDSSIISERRSLDLQENFDTWRGMGCENVASMITWTTPHYLFQPLKNVLTIQDKAMRIMKNQPQKNGYKRYKTIMDEMCSIGAYTGREVTFGRNGWHPHRHDVHFMICADIDQLKRWRCELSIAFAIAFQKAGGEINNMDAFYKRAVRIDQIADDDGYTRVSKYVTTVEGDTWTLAKEATKGIVKTGKNGNITPFGMLEAIRQGDEHSALYSAKFWEYVSTMKGKKQFFPTPGLAKFLGTRFKTDQEVMQESSAGDHYAFLTDSQWHEINSLDIRGEVLALTEGRNEFEFMDTLDALLKEYQIENVA